ncbi:hypothetical protein [Streptomyces sp. ST2-7A]|uniref:hypothetical protein n=1 Tax=Streptomyces sp. ST2-7A TaxID=2907214 RepID=UPI001F3D44B9|nr:hypothetical protein [Streptomyces sp. ST2-7A]MCE7082490.1 hypothetical protein [Streptomyces sp. ST2-7A]
MRVAILTEGGHPYARGESAAWCERLPRGPGGHTSEIHALGRSALHPRPPGVVSPRTAPLWGPLPDPSGPGHGRAGRRPDRRYAEAFAELAGTLCAPGDPAAGPRGAAGPRLRFADGPHTLADPAVDHGGLSGWLRSETAPRVLEAACRAPGAPRAGRKVRVPDPLSATERPERAPRPPGLDRHHPEPVPEAPTSDGPHDPRTPGDAGDGSGPRRIRAGVLRRGPLAGRGRRLPGPGWAGVSPVPDALTGALIGMVVAVALLLPAVWATCCRAAAHRPVPVPAPPARRGPGRPPAAPAVPVTRSPGRAAGSSPPSAEPPGPPTRREQP